MKTGYLDLRKVIKTKYRLGDFFSVKTGLSPAVYIYAGKWPFLLQTYDDVTRMAVTQSILDLEHRIDHF